MTNLEEENIKKRKEASLTTSEWLTFFFIPFDHKGPGLNINNFNYKEEERFKKFGYDKKLKEAELARSMGIMFYSIIFILLIFLFS